MGMGKGHRRRRIQGFCAQWRVVSGDAGPCPGSSKPGEARFGWSRGCPVGPWVAGWHQRSSTVGGSREGLHVSDIGRLNVNELSAGELDQGLIQLLHLEVCHASHVDMVSTRSLTDCNPLAICFLAWWVRDQKLDSVAGRSVGCTSAPSSAYWRCRFCSHGGSRLCARPGYPTQVNAARICPRSTGGHSPQRRFYVRPSDGNPTAKSWRSSARALSPESATALDNSAIRTSSAPITCQRLSAILEPLT